MESLFIKICGLGSDRDVDAAVEAGADAVGFVFAESARRVTPQQVRRLGERVPAEVLTVGVFRSQTIDQVRRIAHDSGVGAIQLHGDEGAGDFAALREWTLIRATSALSGVEPGNRFGADMLLLDASVPGAGDNWDWTSPRFHKPAGDWILAGGLDAGNVAAAVTALHPWGVDVSSGVEVARGVKCPELIASFIATARADQS